MIGLGVGIDYALFIVSRYREGLHDGRSARASTVIAMESAGRAVIFAGTTVMISMLGLLLVGVGSGSAAWASASPPPCSPPCSRPPRCSRRCSASPVSGSSSPAGAASSPPASPSVALLGLGHRVRAAGRLRRRASPSSPCSPAWPSGRCAAPSLDGLRSPCERPSPTAGAAPSSATRCRWLVGATVVLVLLAAPVASLRLGWADDGNFPEGTDTRQAYDLLAEGFGDGFNGPFLITVVPGPTIRRVRRRASTPPWSAPTASLPSPPRSPTTRPSRRAYLMSLVATTAPQDEATSRTSSVVSATTSSPPRWPAPASTSQVTGGAAITIDITDYLAKRMLLFFGAVLALSFVLLMIVFRSLLVPLKAVLMNVLTDRRRLRHRRRRLPVGMGRRAASASKAGPSTRSSR